MLFRSIILPFLVIFWASLGSATPNCPFLGFDLPSARAPSNSTAVHTAKRNVTYLIHELLHDQLATVNSTSFSVQAYSTHEESVLFEYHYAAPVGQVGTSSVDGNTVYRIGSVSKLLFIYLWLIEDGDIHFNDAITNFVPELAQDAETSTGILQPLWRDITIGELASHLGGIGRDYSTPSEALLVLPPNTLSELDLPPPTETVPCGLGEASRPCDRTDFFENYLQRRPVFTSSKTPIYSNVAFRILGYALETITGISFDDLFTNDFVNRLNLPGTSLSIPKNGTPSVIPVSPEESWWNYDLGENAPAGGVYSTPSDLSAIGRSILKSSILSASLTRRWLTPRTHTSSLIESVGAPWEIERVPLLPNQTIDLYTKNGGVGLYGALLVLSPDLDFGVTLTAGGPANIEVMEALIEVVLQNFMPALRLAAQEEAQNNLAGTYSNPALNASIKINTQANRTGLVVSDWIYNSTEVSAIYNVASGSDPDTPLDIALYPTGIQSGLKNGTQNVYYRAVFQEQAPDESPDTTPGTIVEPCSSWASADSLSYGNVALDDIAFTLDCKGRAISVEPRFLGVTLKRL
ncbi:beta-lactamase/transpeptidase-like protein [Talaromyces proteolyticus]|uniref:Beta-lactamase/transpeptidase-like protein n=1 Tax=Talaromyces proteolyticus TaxID=1131652 RepID=A0AAD4Q2Y1_9EURO|nr:beta-lactamase/transpeptidase-like protein [Talaromyces proteolyticus]KAH8700823.1 beta-lactamase/transpeptidase-like protein [Talaromyces proteolyticus]